MDFHLFLYLAAIFGGAYLMKALTSALRIPEVTGYVLLGVIFGAVGFLTPEILDSLSPLSTLALGMISFLIGIELRFDVVRKLGKSIFFIVLFEGMGAFVLVYLFVRLVAGTDPNTALLLAAVASATAPAATVAVIRQYKARGPLTSTILAVVGLDDALTLIIYVFAEGFVVSGFLGRELNLLTTLGAAGLSVLLAAAVGAGVGGLFALVLRRVKNNDWIMVFLAACLLLILGVSELLHLSELLPAMVFGMLVANTSPVLAKKCETVVSGFTPVFLALFFILGGAYLDIRLVGVIGGLGLVYFFSRAAGKIGGATLGAVLGKAQKGIRMKIGLSLLPQVGVALALALAINKKFAQPEFGEAGLSLAQTVINVLLLTTVFTEVLGPLLTRAALRRAGETGNSSSA